MTNTAPSSRQTANPSLFYGWFIVAATFVFMMLIVGFATYGLPLFYPLWVKDFGWRRDQIIVGNTMSKIIIGPILGFAAGWAIEKYGAKIVMLVGALCAALAMFGFSLMNSTTMLYGFFFFNALGYLCAGPLPCQVLLSHWFTRLRGRVMGVAYVGIGVGGMLVPWVVRYFNQHYGWRVSLKVVASLFVGLMLLMLLLVKRRPADLGLFPDGDDAPLETNQAVAPPAKLSVILKTRAFWLLAAGSVLSISSIGGVMQNLALYISDLKPDKAEADLVKTTISSLTLGASIAGRIVMGMLADRFPKKYVMLATYLIVGCAIPLLIYAKDYPALLYVFAVTFGFGLGADYMLIPLMAAECFGLGALSRVLGIIIMCDAVGEATMPTLVASIREATNSYTNGFALVTVLAILGAAAILSIKYRDGKPESRWQLEQGNN